MSQDLKNRIATRFGQHAKEYDQAAKVQKESIHSLELRIPKLTLPKGDILELGSGTGLMSKRLAEFFPDRNLHFTDLCPIMVDQTKERLQNTNGTFQFYQLDGEAQLTQRFAAIFSSFAFQWFENLHHSLIQLASSLLPGGVLLATMPAEGSYPEWKKVADSLDLPFSANPLPDAALLDKYLSQQKHPYQLEVQEHPIEYPSALSFFHHFKMLGATTQIQSNPLPFPQFKRLLRSMDQQKPLILTTKIINLEIHHET